MSQACTEERKVSGTVLSTSLLTHQNE